MPLRDRDWGGLATWLLAAALVVYLALENGGYDPIPRDQIGVAVWWALLLGVAVEALPVPGRTRAALAALGLLLGFAVWTALSLGWTQSAERTATELARVAAYLGVFALGICLVTRRRAGARRLLDGVTFGLALIAALAVLSRLHMAWFPANELGKVLPGIEIERRLAYPLGYSSAIGALAGMTLPLLLAATASARTIAVRALTAAAFPLAGLALYLSTSGTGAAVAAVAMLAFLALSPDRLPKLLTLAAGAGGAAILAAAVHSRGALAGGLPSAAAERQGDEVILIALAVCAGVALLQVGFALAVRHGRHPGLVRISRREALIATAAVLASRSRSRSPPGAARGLAPLGGLQEPRRGIERRAQLALLDPQRPRQRGGTSSGSRRWKRAKPSPGRGSAPAPSSSGGRATAPTRATSAPPTRSTWRTSPSWGSPGWS